MWRALTSRANRPRADGAPASPASGPQLTAFFTSAPILASSAAVSSVSAKAVGHMAPSSRFAWSLKPNVAYLDLNFCALDMRRPARVPRSSRASLDSAGRAESSRSRLDPLTHQAVVVPGEEPVDRPFEQRADHGIERVVGLTEPNAGPSAPEILEPGPAL